MIKKILKIWLFIFNTAVFFTLTAIIIKVVWSYLGIDYVYNNIPVGGDYFNGLTYQIHFSKYLPNPATGWLPFWNEGMPVIGGYPFLSFYLTYPLTKLYEITTAMNIFSINSLVLFFIASLLLFWQVSKNWFIAFSLVAALFATRATFYQLTIGGFIVSASAQWYLPAVLFFIYRFHQNQNWRYLVLSSIFSGLSILHHSATSLLMIFAPSFLILATLPYDNAPFTKRLRHLAAFSTLSFLIGSIGIYATYLQNFLGAGTDACTSLQCWGIYPKHLIVWLTPISPALAMISTFLALIVKVFKRNTSLRFIIPAFAGLSIFVLYALAAHLKLINGPANVIPPTRTFWAANFFVLLIAACAFGSFQKVTKWFAYPLSALIFAAALFFVHTHQPAIHKSQLNTIPADAAAYIIAPYKSKDISEIVPFWIETGNANWRIDIQNQGLVQWWNAIAQMPQVRGYSNNPLGIHRNWQYFLQDSSRNKHSFSTNKQENKDEKLTRNRVFFLLDAFGIGYLENSLASYPESIINDSRVVAKNAQTRDLIWYKLSDKFTTPIVSPTNTDPVLFIGDDPGYETFIRILAMINLNSRNLIPVKGPLSLNKVSDQELQVFPTLILYQYSDSDLNKLTAYVKKGGRVFIEIGSQKKALPNIPEVLPFNSMEVKETTGAKSWQSGQDKITSDIDIQKFSDLSFKGSKWRYSTSNKNSLKNWAKTYLLYEDQTVIAGGQLDNGFIISSSINLPFHILDNENTEEAKLFKNIMEQLITNNSQNHQVTFNVERHKPEEIKITGQNFQGIYFKESFDTGWQAKINRKKAKIYKAGLEFMYIPTSAKNNSEISAAIEYKGNVLTWGLFYLTIFSLSISLLFIILPNKFLWVMEKIKTNTINKLGKKILKFTEDEF